MNFANFFVSRCKEVKPNLKYRIIFALAKKCAVIFAIPHSIYYVYFHRKD